MLGRLANNLGFGAQLAGIHTVEQSGAELARDPVAAHLILSKACVAAASRFGVPVVILGGAGLTGMAQAIATETGLQVIDSVAAGVRYAMDRQNGPTVRADATGQFDFIWSEPPPFGVP